MTKKEDTKLVRERFWNRLKVAIGHSSLDASKLRGVRNGHYKGSASGIAGVRWNYTFQAKLCRVELEISYSKYPNRELLFEELEKEKDSIVKSFGSKLKFRKRGRSGVIQAETPGEMYDERIWDGTIELLIVNMIRLQDTLEESLERFNVLINRKKETGINIAFDKIKIGQSYERNELVKIWGYKSHEAISRGVITPQNTSIIILFVTKKTDKHSMQFANHFESGILEWEGEVKRRTDNRIINARKNDSEIHLFFRKIKPSPFEYIGKIFLMDYELSQGASSHFTFATENIANSIGLQLESVSQNGDLETLSETERRSVRKNRIVQGLFRKKLKKRWGQCSVTGLKPMDLLIASHIKPWRDSDNHERVDVDNGLLLNPGMDSLFDSGYISFDDDGKIRLSKALERTTYRILNVNEEMRLTCMPEGSKKYLEFHRKHIFRDD